MRLGAVSLGEFLLHLRSTKNGNNCTIILNTTEQPFSDVTENRLEINLVLTWSKQKTTY